MEKDFLRGGRKELIEKGISCWGLEDRHELAREQEVHLHSAVNHGDGHSDTGWHLWRAALCVVFSAPSQFCKARP
jgi:hypothetical protein